MNFKIVNWKKRELETINLEQSEESFDEKYQP
eukprot:UN12721